MLLTMMIILTGYVGGVIYIARSLIKQSHRQADEDLKIYNQRFQKLMTEKQKIISEKEELEMEASEIFTLYELTKDVAKNLKEEEALRIFKEKLRENISFKECLFMDPLSRDIKKYKTADNFYIFILKSRRTKLGVLAIEGIKEEDKEKLAILCHQFALALRRIKLYQEFERLAITDSLTGVHTRRYFWERLEEELKRSKIHKTETSILMVDVDHFKKYNDQYGHLAGDQILREISAIIKENIREIDIAGRFGGEEFCVVLPDTNREGAHYVAERIRATTDETPVKAYDTVVKATVSIGIATYPNDGKKSNELVDKADWALYRAKKNGRNRVCAFGVYDQ